MQSTDDRVIAGATLVTLYRQGSPPLSQVEN